jgi:hypothetical protein
MESWISHRIKKDAGTEQDDFNIGELGEGFMIFEGEFDDINIPDSMSFYKSYLAQHVLHVLLALFLVLQQVHVQIVLVHIFQVLVVTLNLLVQIALPVLMEMQVRIQLLVVVLVQLVNTLLLDHPFVLFALQEHTIQIMEVLLVLLA